MTKQKIYILTFVCVSIMVVFALTVFDPIRSDNFSSKDMSIAKTISDTDVGGKDIDNSILKSSVPVEENESNEPRSAYALLREEADSGNHSAAFAVSKHIRGCVNLPDLSVEQYTKKISEDPDFRESNSWHEPEYFDRCMGVSREYSDYIKYLKIAAEGGEPESMLSYGAVLLAESAKVASFDFNSALQYRDSDPQRFKDMISSYAEELKIMDQQGLDYVIRAAKLGHLPAFYVLSNAYETGNGIHLDPEYRVVRAPSLVDSFAWIYAYNIVTNEYDIEQDYSEHIAFLGSKGLLEEARGAGLKYYQDYLSH